jgi:S-(hydroxymethyl)glutathione dehydrogenase / alcohol dehydrogenase
MKAAVLFNTGEPLRVIDGIELPPLRVGQVVVKVLFSGICHSQLMEINGERGHDRFLPHCLGHEGSGYVVEIGPRVTKVKIGDSVILGWIKGRGLESGGVVYQHGGQLINAGPVTTFNDYTVVSENRLVPVPDGVPMDIAALFGCALPTGAGMVLNSLGNVSGKKIAFFGAGGIGLSALITAVACGCSEIFVVDIEDAKLNLAKELGAEVVINSKNVDPATKILDMTSGYGVDYSIESAGLTETIEQAFSVVKKNGGKAVFASHPPYGSRISLDPFDLICGKRICGSWGGDSDPDLIVPQVAELFLKGKLPLGKLLSRRYKLEEINLAIDHLNDRRATRSLIEF